MSTLPAMPLSALAHVVRNKNAGLTQLTVDMFFDDAQGYARASNGTGLSEASVAALYQRDPTQVQRCLLPSLPAIKFSMPRAICAGNPGDGDVYGAQPHAPMLGLLV